MKHVAVVFWRSGGGDCSGREKERTKRNGMSGRIIFSSDENVIENIFLIN
jgi:hypothetical protein